MNPIRTRLDAASREDSGFTLIELLIVIVVLGILSGIAVLAAGQFQSEATDACNEANARIDQTVTAANNVTDGGSYVAVAADCADAN